MSRRRTRNLLLGAVIVAAAALPAQAIEPPTPPMTASQLSNPNDMGASIADQSTRDLSRGYAFCGDGTVDPGEECDDGNTDIHDLCSGCRWTRCGDSFIQRPNGQGTGGPLGGGVEECDDSDRAKCMANCALVHICGDGIIQYDEDCDDGNTDPNDGCDQCKLRVVNQLCNPLTVQWKYDASQRAPLAQWIAVTPVVVRLTDHNGDGRIDANDTPDVVFPHHSDRAQITAVDGQTGQEIWSADVPGVGFSLAAGDIDGDGLVDIISNYGRYLYAFEHDGRPKWVSAQSPDLPGNDDGNIGIADLDQDGRPELFVGASVWNNDGTFRWQGQGAQGRMAAWTGLTAHALDLDPTRPGLELLAGPTLYDATGAIIWSNTVGTLDRGWTGVGDLNGDGRPEIVLVQGIQSSRGWVYAMDAQGMVLGAPHVMRSILPMPVIADINGDQRTEVVVTDGWTLDALQWEAASWTVLWSRPVNDYSRNNGLIAYDFDQDGAAELIYHDHDAWYIIDGRTGATISSVAFPDATHEQIPVVADIDNDGKAEILITALQGAGIPPNVPNALVAYECANTTCGPRAIWNQYQYHISNVQDDGQIPRFEVPTWRTHNTWLTQEAAASCSVCGNGRTESGEQCDDGNTDPSDQCTDTCELTFCGDTTTQSPNGEGTGGPMGDGYEACDDGNTDPADQCTDSCELTFCGDGTTQSPNGHGETEQCDDGNDIPSDGCTMCTIDRPLDVSWGELAAECTAPDQILVTWTTLSEKDTLGFRVEWGVTQNGSFTSVSPGIVAHGPYVPYLWTDTTRDQSPESPKRGIFNWYRIVEFTSNGRGDVSPAFTTDELCR